MLLQLARKLLLVMFVAAVAVGGEGAGLGVGVGVGVEVGVGLGVGVGVGVLCGAASTVTTKLALTKPHTTTKNRAIAATRLTRGLKAFVTHLRGLAQITSR